jgi:PKD domain
MDILASRSTDGGKTFAPPVNLSGTRGLSGSVANPLESAGGSGRAVASVSGSTLLVSWLDDSPANPDIFFLSFDPAAALSNRPPVVSASLVTPVPAEAGTTVVVAVGVVDPDGDPFVVTTDFGDGTGGAVVTGVGNLSHVYAVPGTYTITVTATDSHGAVGSATVPPFRIVEPSASGASLLLPVVLDAPGLGGSRYASEVTIASRAGTPTDVILRYTASQGGGSGFARLTIQPGQQLTLPNFLRGYLRGKGLPIADDDATKVGTLLAVFSGAGSASNFFLGARTFTPAPSGGGTFGLFYPAAGSTTASATIFGLQQNDAQRSNLALVNAGADPITLRVALSGPNGEDLGTLPDQTLGAYGWTQIGQPLLGKAQSGRAIVTRVSGTSPFTAYGVLNDAVTSDGSFLPPILSTDTSGSDLLVPIVLDVQGLGARFRTELTLVNTTSAPLPLNLSYVAATGFGSGSGSVSLTLGPLEQRIVPDAIVLLRGTLPIEADGRDVGGSLLVSAPAGTADGALAVGARTYVPASPSGTFGLFYRGLASGESASDVAFIYGLQENDAQRSNLALVNRGDAGDAITLRVTLFAADGTTTGAPIDRTLAPGEWVQLGRPLLTIGASAGYAKIQRVSGSSRFVAYGVLNDNVTSDGSYIPMSR